MTTTEYGHGLVRDCTVQVKHTVTWVELARPITCDDLLEWLLGQVASAASKRHKYEWCPLQPCVRQPRATCSELWGTQTPKTGTRKRATAAKQGR